MNKKIVTPAIRDIAPVFDTMGLVTEGNFLDLVYNDKLKPGVMYEIDTTVMGTPFYQVKPAIGRYLLTTSITREFYVEIHSVETSETYSAYRNADMDKWSEWLLRFSSEGLDARVDGLIEEVHQEVVDRIDGDSLLADAITTESNRAKESEITLNGKLDTWILHANGTYATKTELSTLRDDLISVSDTVTTLNDTKADKDSVYTKEETDGLLDDLAATVYTKTETDDLLDLKADKATTYTKTDTDTLLALKANVGDSYTKAESDSLYPEIGDVYSKVDADTIFATKTELTATEETINASVDTKLTNYLTETEVNNAIQEAEVGAFNDKGTVATRADLPTTATDFDMYRVLDENVDVYARNVNGTLEWETLSFTVDLSPYETISGATEKMNTAVETANAYTDTGLSNKVDKVAGKGLSSNDFTTADKQSIASNTAAISAEVTRATNAEASVLANAKTYTDTSISLVTPASIGAAPAVVTLTDASSSYTLPTTNSSTPAALLQEVRNVLKRYVQGFIPSSGTTISTTTAWDSKLAIIPTQTSCEFLATISSGILTGDVTLSAGTYWFRIKRNSSAINDLNAEARRWISNAEQPTEESTAFRYSATGDCRTTWKEVSMGGGSGGIPDYSNSLTIYNDAILSTSSFVYTVLNDGTITIKAIYDDGTNISTVLKLDVSVNGVSIPSNGGINQVEFMFTVGKNDTLIVAPVSSYSSVPTNVLITYIPMR